LALEFGTTLRARPIRGSARWMDRMTDLLSLRDPDAKPSGPPAGIIVDPARLPYLFDPRYWNGTLPLDR